MSDNAEEGIARAQAAAAKANNDCAKAFTETHKRSIINLNERILVNVALILFIFLIIFWAITKSTIMFYLSMASMMLLAVLVGILKIRSIHGERSKRSEQATNWKSNK